MATSTVSQQRYVSERSDRGVDELRSAHELLQNILKNENNLEDWKWRKKDKLSEFSDKPKTRSLLLHYLVELLLRTVAAIEVASCNRKSSDDSEIRVLHINAHKDHVLSKTDADAGQFKARSDNECPSCSQEDFREAHYTKTLKISDHFIGEKFPAKCYYEYPPSSHSGSQNSLQIIENTDEDKMGKTVEASLLESILSSRTCDLRVEQYGVDKDSRKPVDHIGQSNPLDKCKSIIFNYIEHCNASPDLRPQMTFSCTELYDFVHGRSYFVCVVRQDEISLEDLMHSMSLLPAHIQRRFMQREEVRYRSFACLSQEWRRRCNIDNGFSISYVVSLGFYFLGSEDEMHCCYCGLARRLSEDRHQWPHPCVASQLFDRAAVTQRTASEHAFPSVTATASGTSPNEEAVDYESPPVSPTSGIASFQEGLPTGSRVEQNAAGNGNASSPLQTTLQACGSTQIVLDDAMSFPSIGNRTVTIPALQNFDSEGRGHRVAQEVADDDNRPTIVEDNDSSATQCQDEAPSSERLSSDEG